MRGQVFILDAVVASIMLALAVSILTTAFIDVSSLLNDYTLYRRYEMVASSIAFLLSSGEGSWGCYIGDVRVVGCVIDRPYAKDPAFYVPAGIKCYIDIPNLASLTGCTSPPSNTSLTYSLTLPLCLTSTSPSACVLRDVTITLWSGP